MKKPISQREARRLNKENLHLKGVLHALSCNAYKTVDVGSFVTEFQLSEYGRGLFDGALKVPGGNVIFTAHKKDKTLVIRVHKKP